MSLRAIQKRDREKLSSSQRQQFISHQQQQQLLGPGVGAMNSGGGDASSTTTNTTAAAMKMTARSHYPDGPMMVVDGSAPAVPSVQSIIQSQNAKRKQKGNAPGNTLLTRPQSTLRRSSSYPTLGVRGSPSNIRSGLRSIKSEGDLCAGNHRHREGRGGVEAEGSGGVSRSSGSSFSTNNLYLGAKSEVCLKTLAVKNMQQHHSVQLFANGAPPTAGPGSVRSTGGASSTTTQQPSKRLYESRRTSELSGSDFGATNNKAELLHHKANHGSAVRIPIVGYEVMEERARFTIFKLRIENSISHTCWLVLRRYTDFVRLNNKLKTLFPHCTLVLPRKKWFGDNFSSGFIDNRIQGLQTFIDTILGDGLMRSCTAVRDFFCLDEPPSYSESMEESRVIFEAQEETISQLKQQLQTKEDLVSVLQTKLATEQNRNKILSNVIRNSVENCAKCSKSIDQQLKEAVHK
ncbi:uncharacterized protein LOC131294963 [Anopheles ziemanni]|uniref:uncharacterized protein LOC131262304 n=1 Tax=Anopheles coustani TaxID=139045 RepID=UPI002658A4C6|nr:uncharacterized protein LOC131262304 [Anopheles coustani]XP_058179002.1 uncharacterized protein LOC131294963 [Anopheles ziemanni]